MTYYWVLSAEGVREAVMEAARSAWSTLERVGPELPEHSTGQVGTAAFVRGEAAIGLHVLWSWALRWRGPWDGR